MLRDSAKVSAVTTWSVPDSRSFNVSWGCQLLPEVHQSLQHGGIPSHGPHLLEGAFPVDVGRP